MNNVKIIHLSFDLGQILNDVLVKCNLISRSINEEAQADIRASIMAPDSPETRSIINRALTEAFGGVKKACQRYLRTGRIIDNNMLEQMVKNVAYSVGTRQAHDELGHLVYNGTVDSVSVEVYKDGSVWKKVSDGTTVTVTGTPTAKMEPYNTDEIVSITYETVVLELHIPNFNVSVTDDLKSSIHKYVVDYIMGRFLQDQQNDKAGEYAALAEEKDYKLIIDDLNARESFDVRKPSWI